jgi:hypothetical protein
MWSPLVGFWEDVITSDQRCSRKIAGAPRPINRSKDESGTRILGTVPGVGSLFYSLPPSRTTNRRRVVALRAPGARATARTAASQKWNSNVAAR